MKLEKMEAFFAARLNGYEEHMMTEIEGAKEFYPYLHADKIQLTELNMKLCMVTNMAKKPVFPYICRI